MQVVSLCRNVLGVTFCFHGIIGGLLLLIFLFCEVFLVVVCFFVGSVIGCLGVLGRFHGFFGFFEALLFSKLS